MVRFVLAATLAGVSAHKSYVMKVSQVIGGANSQLLEIDTDAQTERVVNEELTAEIDFVKGSAVCGDTWFGIGSSITQGGNVIAQVDIPTGKLTQTNVPGLWYQLKCGDTENELYAVSAVSSPPKFALVKLTLGGEFPQVDVVGEFPDVLWVGWPQAFSFSGNELQANFGVKARQDSSAKNGEVYRMDIRTGEITMHKQYKVGFLRSSGVPYTILHEEGGMKTRGIFSEEEGADKLKLCDVDYTGNDAKVSNCEKMGDWHSTGLWWTKAALPLRCSDDGLHYFPSLGGRTATYEPLFGGNWQTGEVTEKYQIQGDYDREDPRYYIGTHACALPEVRV